MRRERHRTNMNLGQSCFRRANGQYTVEHQPSRPYPARMRMGARVLRRNSRGQHLDASSGGEAHSPVRCGSRKRLVHVRRSKSETSHLVIPLNASAIEAVARMLERSDVLGHTEPMDYLWPACQWGRYDPTKPMLKWDTAWRALRDAADLRGLRFHDLRHTAITELAEMGVADHVLESISGHLSRRMLEHYSHIRIDAKRQALDARDQARRAAEGNGNGDQNEANDTAIEAVVEVPDDLTSQSRHSLRLSGSPPSGKLLIPLERRDVRVVVLLRGFAASAGHLAVARAELRTRAEADEGARLEIALTVCDGVLQISITVADPES
jgi:Phage integrase family